MKNKKLSLELLEVESFVTDFKSEDSNTIKGGGFTIIQCLSIPMNCGNPTNVCSEIICQATFGTGGVCDGDPPTRNQGSLCICK